MNTIFFPMLVGHLVADFWLQPTSWVLHKKENGIQSSKLLLHVILASVLPVLFTFKPELWWFIPIIFVTHYFIDVLKTKANDTILTFIADQFIHALILWFLAFWGAKTEPTSEPLVIFWVYASGLVLITTPAGILTEMFLSKIIPNKNKNVNIDISGWIGILERILIFIFIAIGQVSAIGFLIAAKSIFRFNEAKEGNKKAEFFLLGTLASFTVAIIIAVLISKLAVWTTTTI